MALAVGPIGEELAFRGLLYNKLRQALPTSLAIVLQSVAFGLFRGLLINSIPNDHGSYVVGPAFVERKVHEPPARFLRIGVLAENFANHHIADGFGQAVGAKKQDVAVTDVDLVDLGENAFAGSPDRIRHHVAPLVALGLFGRD